VKPTVSPIPLYFYFQKLLKIKYNVYAKNISILFFIKEGVLGETIGFPKGEP
jgi:hypothetical protein